MPWQEFVLSLFTSAEWRVLLTTLLIVTGLTETAKRVFFLRWAKTRRKQAIYATSFVLGLLVALAGAMIDLQAPHGAVRLWTWVVAGTTAGPATNLLHWMTLGLIAWKAPGLAETLKGRTK